MKRKFDNKIVILSNNLNTEKKQSSFLKFFCPCLCSKKSKANDKGKSTYKQQQFNEQHTQNQQNLHQQTQSNLPIEGLVSEFQQDKNKNQKGQNNKTLKLIRQQDIRPDKKTVKFNVKRNNNFQRHLQNQGPSKRQTSTNRNSRDSRQISFPSDQIDPHTDMFGQLQTDKEYLNDLQMKVNKKGRNHILSKVNNNKVINREQLISIEKQLQKMQNLPDYQFLQSWQQNYENYYPINQLRENKLIIIGSQKGRLLTKITSVKIFPYRSAIERYKESLKNKKIKQKYGNQQTNFNSELDKYWDKRYFLFQRFDQGIKLDEQSWYSVTPEAVADYISSKVNVKQTILDAFCGAGGDSIKLATSCKRLIANDIDQVKIKCLINNAKIYDVDNIQFSCQDFFQLKCKVDAVYLAPPWGGPQYFKIQSFHPENFQPKLSQIIQKAFTLSKNIFFLLPANTDIEVLAQIISEKVRDNKDYITQSCGLKLQKIYFNQRLKFILGFFGNTQIQSDIKLTQELSFIYDLLKQNNDGIFKHKRLIRKIREQHGMVNLLNYIFEAESIYLPKQGGQLKQIQEKPLIQKFQHFLVSKKILTDKALQKIKQQQQAEYQYQLKSRAQKNKRQKNKKIQKIKQKNKQRQLSQHFQQNSNEINNKEGQKDKENIKINNYVQGYQQQCPQDFSDKQDKDIPIDMIINSTQKRKKGISSFRNELTETISSNISSEITIQQGQGLARNSIRTVSMVSEFQEQQINNIMNQRNRTNSDFSFTDSIYPIQKFDSLDISIEESGQQNPRRKNSDMKYSAQNKTYLNNSNNLLNRHSSPAYFSPRQNIKMTKNKRGDDKWQKGIVQEVNQDNQKDI